MLDAMLVAIQVAIVVVIVWVVEVVMVVAMALAMKIAKMTAISIVPIARLGITRTPRRAAQVDASVMSATTMIVNLGSIAIVD